MAKWILGATLNNTPNERQSGNALFTVHRRGLVDNAIDSFGEEPALPCGVIMSGRETHYGRRLQVASIDTLLRWFCEGGYKTKITFDVIVFDEAHSHFAKLKKLLDYHDQRRKTLNLNRSLVIGLSATPQAKGLSDVFRTIVLGPETEWLISQKYLSPFRYFCATQGRLDKLVKSGNEFTKASECAAMEGLAGDLVTDWKRYAAGRATVGFFPRRSHAKEAQALLCHAGIDAAYVDATTSDDERRSLFRALNNGSIDYLCNVGIVERGTDIPRIGCVQMCVAVGSLVRYRQMIGRGSRVHPAVEDCIVLDHGGNVKRHGFFEDDPQWTLDTTQRESGEVTPRPTIACPQCKAIYRGGKCRQCGHEPSKKERMAQGLMFDGGELKEYAWTAATTPRKKSCQEIMIESLYRAGLSGRTWKQCLGICYRTAESQGTRFRVPRTVSVGGREYKMLPFGSLDGGRKVSVIYPFTIGQHGGDYLVQPEREKQLLF